MIETIRNKPATMLFEACFTILLVSLISVFLFRGFCLFIKANRKIADSYLLAYLAEEKLCELELAERNKEIRDMEGKRTFLSGIEWELKFEPAELSGLKKARLTLKCPAKAAKAEYSAFYFSEP